MAASMFSHKQHIKQLYDEAFDRKGQNGKSSTKSKEMSKEDYGFINSFDRDTSRRRNCLADP